MLKNVTLAATALLTCLASPVSAKPENLLTLISAQAPALAVLNIASTSTATGVQRNAPSKSKAILVELSGSHRPAGFKPSSADRFASAYCRANNYSRGRALQFSNVPKSNGLFAYTAVDRLVCYN